MFATAEPSSKAQGVPYHPVSPHLRVVALLGQRLEERRELLVAALLDQHQLLIQAPQSLGGLLVHGRIHREHREHRGAGAAARCSAHNRRRCDSGERSGELLCATTVMEMVVTIMGRWVGGPCRPSGSMCVSKCKVCVRKSIRYRSRSTSKLTSVGPVSRDMLTKPAHLCQRGEAKAALRCQLHTRHAAGALTCRRMCTQCAG